MDQLLASQLFQWRFFLFFARGSLTARVKGDVEFRGAKAAAGCCSRSGGGGDKYQSQERGRRGDLKKREQTGARVLFNIHQSVPSLLTLG